VLVQYPEGHTTVVQAFNVSLPEGAEITSAEVVRRYDVRGEVAIKAQVIDVEVAERDALAQRVRELEAALGYIAGWSPGTRHGSGRAWQSGVEYASAKYRKLAREALAE
jgi:hypothetical protein